MQGIVLAEGTKKLVWFRFCWVHLLAPYAESVYCFTVQGFQETLNQIEAAVDRVVDAMYLSVPLLK